MSKRKVWRVAAAAWCAAALTAQQPESKPATVTEPRALVEAMAAAVTERSSYAYKVRTEAKGGGRTVRALTAEVKYRRGEDAPAAFHATGKITAPVKCSFVATSDGENLSAIDTGRRVFEKTPWRMEIPAGIPSLSRDGASSALDAIRTAVPLVLSVPRFVAFAEGDEAVSKGEAKIGDVLCDVVETVRVMRFDLRDGGGAGSAAEHQIRHSTTWWIGREDRLPRKMTMKVPSPLGAMGSIEETFELEALKDPGEFASPPLPAEGCKEGKLGRGPLAGGGDPDREGPAKGAAAADFTVKDAAGKEHVLSKYKGKAVLVHFSTAEDDGKCDDLLAEIKKKGGDKLVVLDLVGGADAAALKKRKTAPFVRCEGGEVADAWGVSLRPFAYFVGPDGKVAETAPTGVVAGSKALADDLVRRVGLWAKDLKKPFPAK